MRIRLMVMIFAATLVAACHPKRPADGKGPHAGAELSVIADGAVREFTQADLLERPDLTPIEVADDVSYRGPIRYQAVPLADILPAGAGGTLEAKALDGFAAEIPLSLVERPGGDARAYLAVEDPRHPWPALPGKRNGAGPFYVVWGGAKAHAVSSEYWPYRLASLQIRSDPTERWPALKVYPTRSEDPRVARGQSLFAQNCLACHRIDGEGNGVLGPDLDRPENPLAYFQRAALHRYIRNPASVRHWPAQQMPGFLADRLSDADVDAIIDYLAAIGRRGFRDRPK